LKLSEGEIVKNISVRLKTFSPPIREGSQLLLIESKEEYHKGEGAEKATLGGDRNLFFSIGKNKTSLEEEKYKQIYSTNQPVDTL